MRNKIFFAVSALFILGVFIYAPVYNILMKNGMVPYENVGNQITPDKIYDDDEPLADLLNGIEEGKRTVVDTYTNYIPFYLEITSAAKETKRVINYPVKQYFSKRGDEIVRKRLLESLGIAK